MPVKTKYVRNCPKETGKKVTQASVRNIVITYCLIVSLSAKEFVHEKKMHRPPNREDNIAEKVMKFTSFF